MARQRREPPPADPHRRRGDRAARGGDPRRPAARGTNLHPSGPRSPGRARAVPLAACLRTDAADVTRRTPAAPPGWDAPLEVVDLIPDELALARAQLASGLYGVAEGVLL